MIVYLQRSGTWLSWRIWAQYALWICPSDEWRMINHQQTKRQSNEVHHRLLIWACRTAWMGSAPSCSQAQSRRDWRGCGSDFQHQHLMMNPMNDVNPSSEGILVDKVHDTGSKYSGLSMRETYQIFWVKLIFDLVWQVFFWDRWCSRRRFHRDNTS